MPPSLLHFRRSVQMRKAVLFHNNWQFIRQDVGVEQLHQIVGEEIMLPHTWNAADGQDGDNSYHRGRCWYVKHFAKPDVSENEELWIEFHGVAMAAEVYLNGQFLERHAGGYATFRVNLTEALRETNVLAVCADNGKNRNVYPQKADFTFYGGIYRDVYLLTVPAVHFALDYYGSSGIKVTPTVSEDRKAAEVVVETWVTGDADRVVFALADQNKTTPVSGGYAKAVFQIPDVHLWDGLEDPYLYQVTASLDSGDSISTRFGCRQIAFDPEKGFFLNGRSYRLCGAARHQDRQGVGSALTKAHHEEDLHIMKEMGANTVRLAHYQHDPYVYDLCDELGITVWAEIPYISEHVPEAKPNTESQLRELVVQNYNHPSVICWSLSNEITAVGGVTEDLVDNHRTLNALCHKLDATRPTTMAHVNMLDPNDPLITVPDICSFNHYYGWYMGQIQQCAQWCDRFHETRPNVVFGISEFGADANPVYQNGKPVQGDWSEGYQAYYHEEMLKIWWERPYLWAAHCWNMFDFAADGRKGGGKPGQNQKGLVTFDRKIKKDAFYIYKAYLSKEPFVHLCGSRYIDRSESETEIKVYSNQRKVVLLVDGREVAATEGDKIFKFHIAITGEHKIEAISGVCRDKMVIRKVDTPNPAYRMDGGKQPVEDWFDREDEILREGYFSIKDSMASVKAHPVAGTMVEERLAPLREKVMASFGGDAAKMVKIPTSARAMMDQMSVEATLKQLGQLVSKQFIRELNYALNQIKKD